MPKREYIANVSPPEKWSAIVALLAATLVSATVLLLAVAIAGTADFPPEPLYGTVAIFGSLTAICGWMLVRLLRRQRAGNGRTVMPEWFIQLFEIAFLIGICATAIFNGRPWLFIEALGVAIAMIGVRSLLQQPIPH